MKSINWKRLLISIFFCQLAGIIGSVFTIASIPTWYARLNKPFFNPPNWVFGPVWTILYLLMGIAFYMIWNKGFKNQQNKNARTIFLIQLILNTSWSIVFFGGKSILGGLIIIILMWLAIAATLWSFWRISKVAGSLFIPYLMWVSFASVLNFYIFRLN